MTSRHSSHTYGGGGKEEKGGACKIDNFQYYVNF